MCIDIIYIGQIYAKYFIRNKIQQIKLALALITKKVGLVKLRTIKESLQLQ